MREKIQLDVSLMSRYREAILDIITERELPEHGPIDPRTCEELFKCYHYLTMAEHAIARKGLVEADWFYGDGNFDTHILWSC